MNKIFYGIVSSALFLGISVISGHAQVHYGEQLDFELRPDEEKCLEILEEIMPGYRDRPMQIDLGLVKAARGVADQLSSDSSYPRSRVSSELIRTNLRDAGVADQRIYFNYTPYQPGGDYRTYLEGALKAAADRNPYTHMGAGVSKPGSPRPFLAVILSERMVEIDPFPMQVSAGEQRELRARLVGPGEGLEPGVLLTSPAGKVTTMPLLKDGEKLFAIIPFSRGPGTYRLEVTVRGRKQSAAAAIMEISASGSGDASRKGVFKIDFKDKIYYDEAEAEADVLLMLNQVRERSGLEPFKLHPKLMDMAKSHAKDMAENNYMGHFSPEHGSVKRRAAQAGIQTMDVFENVFVNISVRAGMEELLASPVHRKHIINPELNRTGVGVAIVNKGGQNWYYMAQEFSRIP